MAKKPTRSTPPVVEEPPPPDPIDHAALKAALAEAHLPALLMAVVHLTGDKDLLTQERRAFYPQLDPTVEPREGGYSPRVQADIRARAAEAISAHLRGAALPAPPSSETIRRMMEFVAGADIPPHYVPFLMDELGLGGMDTKTPVWTAPELKSAASKMRVIVIGAGMSGLLTAIRLKQAGVNFAVIEKDADVGGTWFENVYPGCRVDNPNHMYSFSFEPNHDFPQYYSTQPVLLEYFRKVADKYRLRRHIRFDTTVEEARYDEARGVWRIKVKRGDGATEYLEFEVLVSAVGQLNQPRYPDIPGIDSFKGPSFHSARWRHDVDLAGKRVAVIGTGASAFQFAPEIAPKVAHLDIYQRTPPWLIPSARYHEDVPEGMKWLLEHVPFYDKWYRFYLFWTLTDGVYDAVKAQREWKGSTGAVSSANAELRELLAQAIHAQAADDQALLDKVIPAYPFGGKRPLVDNGVWISTLKRDNVDLITDPIDRITAKGVKTKNGTERKADVLIYGTGFQASRFLTTMKVVGRDGVDLHDAWAGDARAYLGMTVPGFPNFFILYGPNTNIVVNGSIIFFSECSVRYVVGALKMMAEKGARSVEVKREVHDAFNTRVDTANALMAWGSPHVTSWYKNATGRVSQNWPFPLVDYWNATVSPNPEDFRLETKATAST